MESPLAAAWTRIAALAARPDARDIAARFAADPERAARLTWALDDLSLDLSRSSIAAPELAALLALAEAADLGGFRRRLFAGEAVNATEGRSVLHMALRVPEPPHLHAHARASAWDQACADAVAERARMRRFVAEVHAGQLRGATGQPFDTVLNIGIGGSDLGPRFLCDALTQVHGPRLAPHFLANVDGHAFAGLARTLDPARTLILVASKTFTTEETMTNAAAARAWLAAALGEAAVGAHFAALSTNAAAVGDFGIAPERMFGFRDWVGGRYSVWSPIGMAVALAAGWERFAAFLAGGHAMDQHFRTAPFAENLPVLLALAGIWHRNALGAASLCILGYDERLRLLPAYLQQLEMESNGKSVALDGTAATHPTCPIVFGAAGTDAQHSFMQLVHQGSELVPVDFLLAAEPDHDRHDAHDILAANALAQAEALAFGRDRATVEAQMLAAGADAATVAAVAPHRVFAGNRPSTMVLFRRLDAFTLGRLIALYEHKVAVQGCIWGINSFDQWGVELGKVLARDIRPLLAGRETAARAPTAASVARLRALRMTT
ncbi:MAG: glucose-6-phosphate isomerase [Rhodospirillales bacterium]|nr:glucose-6-phosphate isomerase [Rhodospirillales bacterium]